jgi:hypothetical protein
MTEPSLTSSLAVLFSMSAEDEKGGCQRDAEKPRATQGDAPMPSKYEMSILVMRFQAVKRSIRRSLGRKSETDVFFLICGAARAGNGWTGTASALERRRAG